MDSLFQYSMNSLRPIFKKIHEMKKRIEFVEDEECLVNREGLSPK